MGHIRECTVCARRMYSTSYHNRACHVKGTTSRPKCRGVMRLIAIKDRPRNRFKLDGTKLGEFW